MQPTLRHVPPKVPFSSRAIRRSAKRWSAIELPDPDPMIARSKGVVTWLSCPLGGGLTRCDARHRQGWQPRASADVVPDEGQTGYRLGNPVREALGAGE